MRQLEEIKPDHPCDRCGHASKVHASTSRQDFVRTGSRCMMVDGRVWHGERIPKPLKVKQCWCDGYFPR